MDFIANATGAIYAQSWTPAVQKLFGGQTTPDGRAQDGAVRLREAGEVRRLALRSRDDGDGDLDAARPRRAEPDVGVAGPPSRGSATHVCRAGCSSLPALTAYGLFVLWPLVNTFKYSLYSWDGVAPGDVGRARQLQDRLHRPRPRRRARARLQADHLLQRDPGRARPDRRVGDAAGGDAAGRLGGADGALPAAGGPARRGRHRLELGALDDRRRQPGALARSAWAA